jgi:uncharacterized protein (TIGR02996 family)
MTDGYALLRAIEANPDEDTPRLLYADWLEEHATTDADRARAELIRVQCELAREPRGRGTGELAARERQLLNKYREVWESAYPVRLSRSGNSYGRGFLFPELAADEFVKHGAALAAVTPLNYLRLRHSARSMAAVARCPALRHVRYLCLDSNSLRNHHLSELLGSPHLTNIRVLGLGNNKIGTGGGAALAVSAALPALRVLALYGNHDVKDGGLKALTEAPWFANLLGLHVSGCGVSAAALLRLTTLPAVAELRSLDVSDPDRDDTTARAILDSPHLSKLVRLWHPDHDLSTPVRDTLRARFGDKLNLGSYRLDQPEGGLA